MRYNLKSIVLCLVSLHISSNAEDAFEDGKFYIINSVATGRVMTLAGGPTKAPSVVSSPWIARDTQTWLALKEISKQGRTIGNNQKFVLLSQKQSWDWKDYVKSGSVNFSVENLPADTHVLSLDPTAVNLTLERYSDGTSQKWIANELGGGEILLKNWGNQQCVRNFDYKVTNVLESLRRRIDSFFGVFKKKKASPLGTLTCDSDDIAERWMLEPAYILSTRP